jgi:hypothetical protein
LIHVGMHHTFSKVQVPQGWMAGCSAREADKLVLTLYEKLKIPKGVDKRDIWERAMVPSIRMKYINMKCNLNNNIKAIYLSMMKSV